MRLTLLRQFAQLDVSRGHPPSARRGNLASVVGKVFGRAAKRAGIRKGDVILRVGDAELEGPQHFHAWWRLTREPGERVAIELLRGDRRRTVELTVLPDPQ